jgi:hypothetical protein
LRTGSHNNFGRILSQKVGCSAALLLVKQKPELTLQIKAVEILLLGVIKAHGQLVCQAITKQIGNDFCRDLGLVLLIECLNPFVECLTLID